MNYNKLFSVKSPLVFGLLVFMAIIIMASVEHFYPAFMGKKTPLLHFFSMLAFIIPTILYTLFLFKARMAGSFINRSFLWYSGILVMVLLPIFVLNSKIPFTIAFGRISYTYTGLSSLFTTNFLIVGIGIMAIVYLVYYVLVRLGNWLGLLLLKAFHKNQHHS